MPKKKQYLAYIRVSTEEQNFDLQYHAIEKWAEREEDIELTVKEEKESTRNTRPVWEEVKKLLRTKEYDGLVTYNLDRIGRSLGQLVLDIEEIVDVHKRDFIMIQNPELNPKTPTGRLFIHFFGIMGNYERNRISERTKDALAAKKAQGKKLGRPRRHPVQDIYDMIYAGHTNRQIADALGYTMRTIQRIRKNTGKMEATQTPPENPTPNQAQKDEATKTTVYDAERNDEGVSKVTL